MTGSGLMDFVITVVGLIVIVGLFFLAIDYIAQDDRFKKIARWAIGGVALLLFLVAIKGVFFGGGGGLVVSPVGVIEFAVSLIVILVVLYLVYLLIDWFVPDGPPEQGIPPFKGPLKYLIGAVALIVLLLVAGKILTSGGSLGMWNLGVGGRHSRLDLILMLA